MDITAIAGIFSADILKYMAAIAGIFSADIKHGYHYYMSDIFRIYKNVAWLLLPEYFPPI